MIMPLDDGEFARVAQEVIMFTRYDAGVLRPEAAEALLREASRARENEQALIARLRLIYAPGMTGICGECGHWPCLRTCPAQDHELGGRR
jgi:hypothetical protein